MLPQPSVHECHATVNVNVRFVRHEVSEGPQVSPFLVFDCYVVYSLVEGK